MATPPSPRPARACSTAPTATGAGTIAGDSACAAVAGLPIGAGGQRWLPAQGQAQQLLVLLHGAGARGADLAPLALFWQRQFPQAMIVAPDAPEPLDGDRAGGARQWFSQQGIDGVDRPAQVDAALPGLEAWLGAQQQASGVGPAATALIGFSQGAVMALALAQRQDGIAGRVLAFAGRYARLPERALQYTTLHLLHGSVDAVIPVDEARRALAHLAEIGADATLDIVEGAGHEINAALLDCALHRLRSHIPHRTWAAAIGAAPGAGRRQRHDDEHDD